MIQLIIYWLLTPALAIIQVSHAHRQPLQLTTMTQCTPRAFKGQRMFDPCFHQWQQVRWENAKSRRYYEARVIKNLLDEWEVLCLWGGIGTRLGGSTVIPVIFLEEPPGYAGENKCQTPQ